MKHRKQMNVLSWSPRRRPFSLHILAWFAQPKWCSWNTTYNFTKFPTTCSSLKALELSQRGLWRKVFRPWPQIRSNALKGFVRIGELNQESSGFGMVWNYQESWSRQTWKLWTPRQFVLKHRVVILWYFFHEWIEVWDQAELPKRILSESYQVDQQALRCRNFIAAEISFTRTYLASNLQKTVFAEHAVDEDDGKKGKKKAWAKDCSPNAEEERDSQRQDRQAGKQRGFIVLVPQSVSANINFQQSARPRTFADFRRVDQDERANVPSILQARSQRQLDRIAQLLKFWGSCRQTPEFWDDIASWFWWVRGQEEAGHGKKRHCSSLISW